MTDGVTPAPAGAVYDRGYRPYDGPRGARAASRAALWRLTVRRALGLRRSWRQKVTPFLLLGMVTIPAVVNVGIGYLTRNTPAEDFEFITYREYVGVSAILLLFVAHTAPDVMCPDRRYRMLPLLFSRPIDHRDYVGAKVGAIFAILFGFSFLPQVVLFVGQMLVDSDGALDYFTENVEVLWQVPLAVTVLALYYTVIGVSVSSLTSRRVVAGATLLAIFLVSSVVSSILVGVEEPGRFTDSPWALVNLLALPLHVRDVIFLGHVHPESPLGGVGGGGAAATALTLSVVVAGIALLLRRYREVQL